VRQSLIIFLSVCCVDMGGGSGVKASAQFGPNNMMSNNSRFGGAKWLGMVIDENYNIIVFGGVNTGSTPAHPAINYIMMYGPQLNCSATHGQRLSAGAWNCTYCDPSKYGPYPCTLCEAGFYCPGE
jgi:hypothetical protein